MDIFDTIELPKEDIFDRVAPKMSVQKSSGGDVFDRITEDKTSYGLGGKSAAFVNPSGAPSKTIYTPSNQDIFENQISRIGTGIFAATLPEGITPERALEDQKKFNGIMMRAPAVALSIVNPIFAVAEEAVQQGINAVVASKNKEKYSPLEVRVVSELLPKEAPTAARFAVDIAAGLTSASLMGAAANLAKKGLLKSTIDEIGHKLEKAGYGTGQVDIPKEAFDDAIRGTTLEKEAIRYAKAKKFKVPPKEKIAAAEAADDVFDIIAPKKMPPEVPSMEGQIKFIVEQSGGKVKAISSIENSLFDGEPTVYVDFPHQSGKPATFTMKASEVTPEKIAEKIAQNKGVIIPEQSNLSKVETGLEQSNINNIEFINLGIGASQVGKNVVNDTIAGSTAFTDPAIEARFQSAKGVETTPLQDRIKNYFTEFYQRATRVYPHLPNDPQYAPIRNILSKQNIVKHVSQERAIRAIDSITAGMGPNKLDLLRRKVILDDLTNEAAAGRELPFGYSERVDGEIRTKTDVLAADKKKIDDLIAQNPDIQEALAKRQQLWTAVQDDLVKYDIVDKDKIKQNYFRHQVIEYARMKATFGTGKKLRAPKPGYSKARKGSSMDINTDYVQAEFEVLAQAMHDIETMKNIKLIEDSPLNIVGDLRKQAAEQGIEDWHELIPEGYTTWQPMEGNVFYMANSIPERVIRSAMKDFGGEIGIHKDDLQKVLAIGGNRKEFVLPEPVADTLSNLYDIKSDNMITAALKETTKLWKRWILLNPRRAFKYNLQNFVGDFDAIIAGDPNILKKFTRATGELYDVFYKGKPFTPEMREFFERGGLSTQMTVQELPELNKLEIFQRLAEKETDVKKSLNLWKRYWNSIGTATTYRESILRYAAYLHYREKAISGGISNYGASVKQEVDALTDPLDKASKLAVELLGDYSNITALGRDMRESVAPFYSFLEINARRYPRLLRNSFDEGWQKGIRVSSTLAASKGSFFLAKWMLRAMMLTGLAALYNKIRFPEEEQDLSEYDKNRTHIILGKDKDGNILLLRSNTAFGDIIEWVGLDAAPTLWKQYFEGKVSLTDLFGNIPGTDLPAFGLLPTSGKIGMHPAALKMIRAVSPAYKLPAELLTGKSLPVFDDRSWKVEDKMRQVAKTLSAENEYDFLTKKPSRGYIRSLQEAFVAVQNPKENAYRYIQGEKYNFLETVKGRGGTGDYYSPRSIVYREYKKALRFKDKSAEERALAKMEELGVSSKDLDRSLSSADPLFGLNKEEKQEFYNNYLSDYDRSNYFDKAMEFYKETYK